MNIYMNHIDSVPAKPPKCQNQKFTGGKINFITTVIMNSIFIK